MSEVLSLIPAGDKITRIQKEYTYLDEITRILKMLIYEIIHISEG